MEIRDILRTRVIHDIGRIVSIRERMCFFIYFKSRLYHVCLTLQDLLFLQLQA